MHSKLQLNGAGLPAKGLLRTMQALLTLVVLGGSTLLAPAPTPVVAAGADCAWPHITEANKTNVLYPDRNATYWSMDLSLEPGTTLLVRGTFPAARYFSFVAYTSDGEPLTNNPDEGNVIDGLRDNEIVPDQGSKNPFADPTAPAPPGGSYTLVVSPTVAPNSDPNTIASRSATWQASTFLLAYRVYVPTDPNNLAGSAPLPRLSKLSGGTETPIQPCARSTPYYLKVFALKHYDAELPPPPATPTFVVGSRDNVGANPDNAYLSTPVSRQQGRIVVIRGKAATFPDTRHGERVTDPVQLRYWSMCTNEYRMPLPVTDCAADFETALDGDGYYTYVASARIDRPRNATAANGVTWLRWNPLADVTLILRNMLPSAGFHQAVQDIDVGEDPATVMGSYFPRAAYCTKAQFEQGGAKACLP